MLAAILQRQGHTVYGQGSVDYWRLSPAPSSVCFAVTQDGQLPDPTRHANPQRVTSLGGLSLYRDGRCSA
jgi:hypothetical protein